MLGRKDGTADGAVAFGISNSAISLITRMIHTMESLQMKRLSDTLIAYWKMIVSMGDYAFSLDRKKETPRPRLPQAHRYHA